MQKRAELDGQRRAPMLFCLAYGTEYATHEIGRITSSVVVSVDACFRFGRRMWLIMCFPFLGFGFVTRLTCVLITV